MTAYVHDVTHFEEHEPLIGEVPANTPEKQQPDPEPGLHSPDPSFRFEIAAKALSSP